MNKRVGRVYEFSDYCVDAQQRELRRCGQPIPLTIKAFEVLLTLVENRGRIIEKAELLDAVWPDSFVEENSLARNISVLRQIFGDARDDPHYIETVSRRGYRFIAEVKESTAEIAENASPQHDSSTISKADGAEPSLVIPKEKIEPVGGSVPLDSDFYIFRPADEGFRAAIARGDSIILLKGARQIGKTSLLARGLQQAREAGAKVVLTDFQIFNAKEMDSARSFFQSIANMIAEQLEIDVSWKSVWDEDYGPNVNFERYIRREVLQKTETNVVWGLDEADRLFAYDYGSEVFSLFRSWHNMRSLNPAGPWRKLTLAIAYATEAHLFITDLNHSPFNVGTQLLLNDFTIDQTSELNRRYGSPLMERETLERFYGLVGGHPYLVRKGLYEMAQGMPPSTLESLADSDGGPFGNHLRRIFNALSKDAALFETVKDILKNRKRPSAENFFRLRSAGLLSGNSAPEAKMRCRLYSAYLKRNLL